MQTATLAVAAQPECWASLDEPAEWQAFSRRVAGTEGAWESYLSIQGMYCPACSLTVEEALLGGAGVGSVQVNGATGTARVVWSPGAGKPSEWIEALQRAGYGALPAGDLIAAVPRVKAQRLLLWRWLVAGFCMMQVMMYATPASFPCGRSGRAQEAGHCRPAPFLQHNAFRAPGTLSVEELGRKMAKVDYFAEVYGKMRSGIVSHPAGLTTQNVHELGAMNFRVGVIQVNLCDRRFSDQVQDV